jgi:toxin ParE1/3/4
MLAYELAQRAKDDLADLWLFHEAQSVALADQHVAKIFAELGTLVLFPNMGRARDDLRPGLRVWPCDRQLIFYINTRDGLKVQRVLHGHRDIEAMFADPD